MDLCIGWLRYPSNRISAVIPSIFPLWLRKMIKYCRCPDWCSDAINFLHIGKLPLRKTKQIHSEDMTQFPASLMEWHKWPSAMALLPRLVSLILIDWAVILLKTFCHKNSNKTVLISFLRIFSRFRARALQISSVALHRVHLLDAWVTLKNTVSNPNPIQAIEVHWLTCLIWPKPSDSADFSLSP